MSDMLELIKVANHQQSVSFGDDWLSDAAYRRPRRAGSASACGSGAGTASLICQGCRPLLVIHGIWAYGALQVWAEDSVLPAQAPPRPGRPSRAPRPHPFAAPPGELADSLADAGVGDLARKAVDDELTLQLPSRVDGPLASPELVRPSADVPSDASAGRRIALAAWRVPVLVFEPAAATALLSALAGLAPGDLAVSGSIGYLTAVARFTDDLVARGRVLPALTAEEGGYAARWRPVLSAADAQRIRELAAAMPPACRAADDAEPGPLIAGMLDVLSDALVRTR